MANKNKTLKIDQNDNAIFGFVIRNEPIQFADLHERVITANRKEANCGAFASFLGIARADFSENEQRNETEKKVESKRVVAIDYQAYAPLAKRVGTEIIETAISKFDLKYAFAEHSTSLVQAGEVAFAVIVMARHRKAAFTACAHLVDEIKAKVPIFKKEIFSDGSAHWL